MLSHCQWEGGATLCSVGATNQRASWIFLSLKSSALIGQWFSTNTLQIVQLFLGLYLNLLLNFSDLSKFKEKQRKNWFFYWWTKLFGQRGAIWYLWKCHGMIRSVEKMRRRIAPWWKRLLDELLTSRPKRSCVQDD